MNDYLRHRRFTHVGLIIASWFAISSMIYAAATSGWFGLVFVAIAIANLFAFVCFEFSWSSLCYSMGRLDGFEDFRKIEDGIRNLQAKAPFN